jgi:hypothetical protein
MSSCELKIAWCSDDLVELSGDVALETADDLFLGHAFLDPFSSVRADVDHSMIAMEAFGG